MTDLFVMELSNSVSFVYSPKTLQLHKVPVKDLHKVVDSHPTAFVNENRGMGDKIYLDSYTHRFVQGSYGMDEELYIYNSKKFTLGGRFHTITALESMNENGLISDISVDGETLKYDFSDCIAWKNVWLYYVVKYKKYYLFYYKFDYCRFILVFDKYSLLYMIGNNAEYIGGIEKEFVKAKIGGLVDLFYDIRGVATDDVLHFEL